MVTVNAPLMAKPEPVRLPVIGRFKLIVPVGMNVSSEPILPRLLKLIWPASAFTEAVTDTPGVPFKVTLPDAGATKRPLDVRVVLPTVKEVSWALLVQK